MRLDVGAFGQLVKVGAAADQEGVAKLRKDVKTCNVFYVASFFLLDLICYCCEFEHDEVF